MSRSCHSATFSSAACRLPGPRARVPRCVRRARGCACAASRWSPSALALNGSCTSRTSVRARWRTPWRTRRAWRGDGERPHELGVDVARDDLARCLGGPQPELRTHVLLDGGIDGRVRPHDSRDRPTLTASRARRRRSRSRSSSNAHSASLWPNSWARRARHGCDPCTACRGAASASRFTTPSKVRPSRATGRPRRASAGPERCRAGRRR